MQLPPAFDFIRYANSARYRGRLGIFIKDICFYIFRAHDED